MHYRKFRIDKYRAVDSAEMPVGNKLIPLIGVNESGKTSILKAILCFDRNSDRYAGGEHLTYRNNYLLESHECTISAEIVIDSEKDIDAISEQLELTRGDELVRELEDIHKSKKPLTLHRNLSNKRYSITGIESSPSKHKQLAKAIYDLLPLILYFDDFTDRVPESLVFTRSENGEYKISHPRLGEWQRILEEIFVRATGDCTLKSFLEISNENSQDGMLNDINDVLDKEIMTDWRRLKKSRGQVADDTDSLKLELKYKVLEGQKFEFQFRVTDRARAKGRIFSVVERSKGFQWFFNFLMKLKFNPKYQENASDAIYLLDEPGSYLHSSAQEELLSELKEISQTNTILYCTHSQHLLDPDVINIGQTRIAEKLDGKVSVVPFGSAKTENYQGALSPLYQALQLRTGIFNRSIDRAIVTEGIVDYYWFSMLRQHVSGWAFDGIDFIPGAGAGQLKEMISWSIAYTKKYLVLLDSDQQGLDNRKRYKRFFGTGEKANFQTYTTPSSEKGIELEDLISENNKREIKRLTGAKNTKHAITQLFYSSDDLKIQFFKCLDAETVNNHTVIQSAIAHHFSGEAEASLKDFEEETADVEV